MCSLVYVVSSVWSIWALQEAQFGICCLPRIGHLQWCLPWLRGLVEKVHIFHCFGLPYHGPLWVYLRCLKGTVGSCWPSINVVKSWLYGVDLLLSGSELRRSLERSVD